ncbi:MAG: TolB family protein [Gammaproteobacteria bacterium]
MQLKQKKLLFIISLSYAAHGLAQSYPVGLSFVGLSNDQWAIYAAQSGRLAKLSSASEPRTPIFHNKTQRYAYIGADASLHEVDLQNSADNIVKPSLPGHAYTQPTYDDEGKRLFVVSLKEGTSVDTDILMRENGRWRTAVNQRSAQFEPYFQEPSTLYYANVHCTEDCGRIIQEIWRKDLISGIAEQVTLTNSISRQPVVSKDGKDLYFSSNKSGYYHIWRLSLATNTYHQLTTGAVTDENPALDGDGKLYFIRHTNNRPVAIMQWQERGEPIEIALPARISEIRDLEIRPTTQ